MEFDGIIADTKTKSEREIGSFVKKFISFYDNPFTDYNSSLLYHMNLLDLTYDDDDDDRMVRLCVQFLVFQFEYVIVAIVVAVAAADDDYY